MINNNQPAIYLENRAAAGRSWVVVQLRSAGPNSHAIGARVWVTAGGRKQVREIHAGSGYLSSPAPEAHFGLGAAKRVDRLEIRWPDGRRQVLTDQGVNKVILVREGRGGKR